LPHPGGRQETAVLPFETIEAFEKLAESLQVALASHQWRSVRRRLRDVPLPVIRILIGDRTKPAADIEVDAAG
jgi:hypothetical protein